ncbi:MAG: hypothetical protein P8L77_00005, partial [Gammaproteobacteria bacterium]|nr:hypothetical protein [Gammaproteobacteria bacterium]
TWNGFIRNLFQARLQLQNLNDNSQITHTASIHESVSDSAIALTNKYGKNINKTNVIKHVKKLKNNIKHFTPNETITPHIYEAAKRGIDRLANFDTDFIDPKSQISIKQLIALTHIAAQDNDYRLHTYNHYLEAMILALYEIQRGYNLDAAGIDNMHQDIPICTAGTFNKIIEKMVGILPYCHIHFITFDIINFKANQLVKNIISKFFDDRASLVLANEADLVSLEFLKPKEYINLLKDIESNDYSNPLLQALLKELSNHIEQALRKIFGAHLDRHFNNYFTIEHFILNALSQNEIKTLVTKKVDAISCQHNYKQRIYADFSLFYSPKQSKRSKGFTINLRKQTFSNVRTSIDSARQ